MFGWGFWFDVGGMEGRLLFWILGFFVRGDGLVVDIHRWIGEALWWKVCLLFFFSSLIGMS